MADSIASMQSEVAQSITNLKAQIDALKVPEIGGRNLLVTAEAEKDTMISSDGKIGNYPGSSLMKNFIPVTSGENLIFQRWGTQIVEGRAFDDLFRYAYYDTDKNLIKRNTAGYDEVSRDVVPNGASLMRVSYPNNLQVQVERGTVPTDWTPAPEDVQAAITNALGKVDVGKTITATDDTGKTVNLKITGIS